MGMDLTGIEGAAKEIMGGLDSLFTSDDERETAKQKLISILQKPHILAGLAALEDAKSEKWWKAGWRPAIGWLCVVGLGLHFVVFPVMESAWVVLGWEFNRPEIDAPSLMTLVLSLLGLGGLRTYEKFKGLTK